MPQFNQDKIKLAEAMGWESSKHLAGDSPDTERTGEPHFVEIWRSPPPTKYAREPKLPDPFTDANDDYAVLEWMRKRCWLRSVDNNKQPDYRTWDRFCEELLPPEDREIGDYARAALKVIDERPD